MVRGNVIKAVQGEKAWVTYAKRRIRDNQNFVAVVTGETGSGKSYSALAYALQIDPTFDVNSQVVFYFRDLMALINDELFHEREWKIILWDEIQIEMSNRKWQSTLNQSIVELLSTFRAQNIILIMTAPNKSMLDSQVKKLIHAEFKCKGFMKKTNLCKIMPRYLQYNPDKDRIYPHKLMHNIEGIGYNPVESWYISKAPKQVLDIYEEKKRRFNISLNRKIENALNAHSSKPKEDGFERTKKVKELYLKYGDDFIKINEEMPHLSIRTIREYVASIKKSLQVQQPETAKTP